MSETSKLTIAPAVIAAQEPSHKPVVQVASAGSPWRWVIAFVMLVTIVTGFFDRISVAVLFTNKGFNDALGTNFQPAVLGFLMTAFLLAYAISALFLSFTGDIWGPRRALGSATALWGILMMLMGSCGSFGVMLFLRIILGLSEGPQFSFVSKTISRWFPPHERARANSIWLVGSPLGSAIGFPLTIWLVSSFGWRASFFVLGLLSILVVAPLIFATVRDRPSTTDGEARHENVPMKSLRLSDVRLLLANGHFWMLSIYSAGLLIYLWGLNTWLPTYLERERHFNMKQMGIYSSLPFILMFLAEISSGLISDWLGKRALICVLGLFTAGVLLLVATHVDDPHVAAILIALSAGAWGFGLPTQYALAMKVIPESATSTGIGVMNGFGNLVGAFAPALIGWIVLQTGDFQSGLLVIVVGSVIGSCALLPMVRSH